MTLQLNFSGKADRIHIQGDRALIIDFKTARGETASAERNPQLRALAVLVWGNFMGIKHVTVAIVQPWASPQVSVCEYTREDLCRAHSEIEFAVEKAGEGDAPRIPGERQCKYCRGKKSCPEYLGQIDTGAMARLPDKAGILALRPAELALYLVDCDRVERVIETLRATAKERLALGEEIPGWQLKPGAIKSTIVDVRPIYARLISYGVGPEEFAEIVKVTKKDLTALLKRATGYKGGELDSHLETLLEGCTEEKQNAPSLERIK